MERGTEHRPSWDRLFELAAGQGGLFTTQQAAEAGYSPQLLIHHVHAGRVRRLRRGVYRIVHFPGGEHEDLVAVWLWSERQGVISHRTALALHSLSDVLPSRLHVTLPEQWRQRRLRVPAGVVMHHSDIPPGERSWIGPVPVTSPVRTIRDCWHQHLSPELLLHAVRDALARGLVAKGDVADVECSLAAYNQRSPRNGH